MTSPKLSSLHIYPIKSSAGITLSNSWVDDYGLSFDRRFVVTDCNGKFITARTKPTLCLVQANLTANGLILTAPNMPALHVVYHEFSTDYHGVTVWKDQINSQYCHRTYDEWFSKYLGTECMLHFFGEQSNRPVIDSDKQVGFADAYPLLLISQASLTDLNSRIDNHNVSMSQFRPNIVVENTTAFEEDTWKRIKIGEVEFEATTPCSRCVFTTVDPRSGIKHAEKEPLRTLKEYRRVPRGEVMFGQNLIALNHGEIKQGDEITVISRQPPFELKSST